MQKWTPNVAGIIEHAKEIHPKTEVISRLVSGEVHRTNYEQVCIRSRKLASALEKDGVKNGDVIATLALVMGAYSIALNKRNTTPPSKELHADADNNDNDDNN